MGTNRPMELVKIARELASTDKSLQTVRGPGQGNQATNAFMNSLITRAMKLFGVEVSEQKLCGKNSLAVDIYFKEEATIVEVTLGLPNPEASLRKMY